MATKNFVPRADSEGGIGTAAKRWLNAFVERISIGDGAGCFFKLPSLTTAQRNSLTPVSGMVIYNSTKGEIEKYGDSWCSINSGAGPIFSRAGILAVIAGTFRWYPDNTVSFSQLSASVGAAPTGQAVIVTFNKNGTSIGVATITAGQYKGTTTLSSPVSFSSSDYMTVDITQIGSSLEGEDLIAKASS